MSTHNILFISTGNSSRSIMAEAIMNHLGPNRFTAYSAGSRPAGNVNAHALHCLERNQLGTEGLRSKSWSEFAAPDAPTMDFVITVCDNAAGEVCPVWPGQPMTAHWGVEDPGHIGTTDAEKAKALKAAGRDIISFSIGVPNFLPGPHIYAAAAEALAKDSGQYGSNRGADALLDAFLGHIERAGLTGYTRANIATGIGAKPK